MADLTLTLDDLALQISSEHAAALEHAESAVAYARQAGALLIEARRQVGHKRWLPWLAEHIPSLSARTAQRYMRLTKHPQIEAESVREALARITIPRLPKTTRVSHLPAGGSSEAPPGPINGNPDPEPPFAETAEDGTPTPEDIAEFEALEREQVATFEKLLVSDEPLRTANEELTRKDLEITALKASRDHFMEGKKSEAQKVEELRRTLNGKDGEIEAQAAEIRRLVGEIENLREENGRLRERIAIMEEAA